HKKDRLGRKLAEVRRARAVERYGCPRVGRTSPAAQRAAKQLFRQTRGHAGIGKVFRRAYRDLRRVGDSGSANDWRGGFAILRCSTRDDFNRNGWLRRSGVWLAGSGD